MSAPFVRVSLLTALILLASLTSSRAETGQEAYSRGKADLKKANFNQALQAFAAAVRSDRENPDYLQHYLMVRQVVDLRKRLEGEKDSEQWEYMARGLRSFYLREGILPEAVAISQQMHARENSTTSAALLADLLLLTDRDAQTIKMLTALAPDKTSAATQSHLGLALARTGKVQQARDIARAVSLPENASPGLSYVMARLSALTGDTTRALGLLTKAFESMPPSRLDAFKAQVGACPDLAVLAATPQFARVLETKSRVAESPCSGGSNCSSCPMRGKCPNSGGKDQ